MSSGKSAASARYPQKALVNISARNFAKPSTGAIAPARMICGNSAAGSRVSATIDPAVSPKNREGIRAVPEHGFRQQ